jgi:hypothetical protein
MYIDIHSAVHVDGRNIIMNQYTDYIKLIVNMGRKNPDVD